MSVDNILYNTCKKLINSKIKLYYNIQLSDGNIDTGIIDNCNIVGSCLENILLPYLKNVQKGPSQSSPDFLSNEYEYELKCFINKPSFDISNFHSYINQLNEINGVNRKVFNTKYLIFKYDIKEETIHIKDFKMCNVWNLVNYTGKYPISIQNKNGTWYNIRPCSYNNIFSKDKTPELFINKLCEAIHICPNNINNRFDLISNIKTQFNKLI